MAESILPFPWLRPQRRALAPHSDLLRGRVEEQLGQRSTVSSAEGCPGTSHEGSSVKKGKFAIFQMGSRLGRGEDTALEASSLHLLVV